MMRLLWIVGRTEVNDRHYVHKRVVQLETGKEVYRYFPMYRRGSVGFHYMRNGEIVHYPTEQDAVRHISR